MNNPTRERFVFTVATAGQLRRILRLNDAAGNRHESNESENDPAFICEVDSKRGKLTFYAPDKAISEKIWKDL